MTSLQTFTRSLNPHSFNFYSASSSPLLLRGTPDTARILCRSFTPKLHRELRVKGLPKFRTLRLERDFELATLRTKIRRIYQWATAPHKYFTWLRQYYILHRRKWTS